MALLFFAVPDPSHGGLVKGSAHGTPERWLDLGHLYLDQGRLQEAATAYRRILDADGENAEALTHRPRRTESWWQRSSAMGPCGELAPGGEAAYK